MRARFYCGDCLTARDFAPPLPGSEDCACAKCGKSFRASFASAPGPAGVERCGFCRNRAFFLQKDFDQRLGCLIMAASLAAALFIGRRFGWIYFTPVLLGTVLIDWVVATRIRPVTICYRCDAEYREMALHPRHKPYDPHVAERYAATKTVRRMR